MMKQKDWDDIEQAIACLPIKKVLKLKVNGIKVKVVRNANGSFGTYLEGQWISDDIEPKDAFSLSKSLLTQQ
jgi:hypothetical protein